MQGPFGAVIWVLAIVVVAILLTAGRHAASPLTSSPRVAGVLLFLCGLAASFVVHWPILGYGFAYDDYGFIHPYTLDQVLASFWGPWDPGGPNVAFFRPLAVTFHAVRFEWLQFDPWAHHVLSLALFGVAVGVLGVTVRRMTDSAGVALLAIAFTAAHPHMAISATAWITNRCTRSNSSCSPSPSGGGGPAAGNARGIGGCRSSRSSWSPSS